MLPQDHLNEWANMTGFLCALGSVCLQNKSHRARFVSPLIHHCIYWHSSSNITFNWALYFVVGYSLFRCFWCDDRLSMKIHWIFMYFFAEVVYFFCISLLLFVLMCCFSHSDQTVKIWELYAIYVPAKSELFLVYHFASVPSEIPWPL